MSWFSVIPPMLAILVVLWRREVILALVTALISSEVITLLLAGSSPLMSLFGGLIGSIESTIEVLGSAGNARILVFSLLVGALLAFMRQSGGVSAFVGLLVNKGIASTPRRTGLLTFFTGVFVFIESNLSVLTAGIISRGLFDKFKMSRARLAYIIDSTSAPICILILLNAWGAYILGLVSNYELGESSVTILIGTIPLNFYAWFTLLLVLYTVITGRVHGPMKKSERKLSTEIETQVEQIEATKVRYMLLPLATMVFGMIGFMLMTGNGDITQGSGSQSVLYATLLALLVAYTLLRFGGGYRHQGLLKIAFDGMSDLLPLVIIVLLSLALGTSLRALGTGEFIAGIISANLPLFIIPALLFVAGAVMSFTTGTSWGTFAILVPIGMPLVINLDLDAALVLSAILGGGIFGDHASPISDTTAVSSVASGCDLLEHVETQMPYALTSGAAAFIAYIIAGIVTI
ncbi:Na+/H+ antiporter NhaC family protein [uncultured Umboniibacter sp.]|uniref:Na+/H+ antiporter NhaC family protein n=1 Tax=uncultured Umboniibacter sp. TaxID=1798917 RepID=UPI0026149F55|nr:Na+/H+ antiporter NhaC family protein [uncultured Umboniibacter sp.]